MKFFKYINKYVLGKPQPVRLYPIKNKKEMLVEWLKEWWNVLLGLLLALIIVLAYTPFYI